MNRKAQILSRLYEQGRVTDAGLRNAVADGVITEDEYREIVGDA